MGERNWLASTAVRQKIAKNTLKKCVGYTALRQYSRNQESGYVHHHPHGAAQGRQSLRASRRRLGERLRTGSGISGNGEQEQSDAQSRGLGGDVWAENVKRDSLNG